MKTYLNSLVFTALIFFSCNTSSDKVADSIPGIYVLHSEGEYSKAQDTLILDRLNATTFRIKRSVSFQRIRGGRMLPKQYKQEIWTGICDRKDQSIHETRSGKQLTMKPNSNSLLLGTAEYLKIK